VIEALGLFFARQGLRDEADRYIKMLQLVNPLQAAPAGLGEQVVTSAQREIADLRGLPETLRKTPDTASSFLAQIQASLARADARDRIRKLTDQLSEATEPARILDLRLERASAYREIGEFDAAARDYDALTTQIAPADPEPWKRLAQLHLEADSWDNRSLKDAVRSAEAAARLDPGAPSCQETLADAYLAADRLEDAERVLDALLARTAEGPDRKRYTEKRSRCTVRGPR
jgi:predicted Zn-dependent protease